MANKVTVKRTKKTDMRTYDILFSGLTAGEVVSIKNALESYSVSSIVARDVLAYLNNGIKNSDDESIKV